MCYKNNRKRATASPGHNHLDQRGRYCIKIATDCLFHYVIDVATKTEGSFDINEFSRDHLMANNWTGTANTDMRSP